MIMRLLLTLLAFILVPNSIHAATTLTKVLLTTGSVSEREAAVYVAQEQGYFRKYGVEVHFVQTRNGPVGMAALSSGESRTGATSSVLIRPGRMQLTLTHDGPSSSAASCMRWSMPDLDTP